jgi:hypothetical protein
LDKLVSLPIQSWAYKTSPDTRHLGPVAQDFHGAFNLGVDDKHIATVDADGVALAAIQGLNWKVEDRSRELEERLERKEAEIAALKARLERLEQILSMNNGGVK